MLVTNHGGASNNITRSLIISRDKRVRLQVESPRKCKEDLQNLANGMRREGRCMHNADALIVRIYVSMIEGRCVHNADALIVRIYVSMISILEDSPLRVCT